MAHFSAKTRRLLWLALALISAISMWNYEARIWALGQPPQFSDLYARWWGAHELLLHHRDPYSVEVSHEIQQVIYGAPITTTAPGDPAASSGGFAYPIYVAFLLWPTVGMSFATVHSIFACLLPICVLAGLLLWLYTMHWRLEFSQFAVIAIFVLGSFPTLQGLKLQNLSLLAAFLIAASIASLASDHLVTAGAFLAVATIKPQFVFLLAAWLALWVARDWKHRRAFAISFTTSLLVLVLGGELLLPGWIGRFLHIVAEYKQYTYGHSVLDIWFTPTVGPLVGVVFVVAVLYACWSTTTESASSPRFLLNVSLLLAVTLVVIPTLEPHAQLLLIPGFLLLLDAGRQLRKISRLLVLLAWFLLAWSWIAAAGLTLGSLWLPITTVNRFWIIPLATSPLIPLGVTLALFSLRRTTFPVQTSD